MIQENIILFDLDGTLTDSEEGITKSVQYSAQKMGRAVPDRKQLQIFVGPPLKEMMMQFFGYDFIQADRAVMFYRQRYTEIGMFENKVYPGIPMLLEKLSKEGKCLAVATSKPERFARKILEHFQLANYFSFIGGPDTKNNFSTKAEVIEYTLSNLKDSNKENAIMIGDTSYDIIGAKNCNIKSIAVGYGYGEREELLKQNPDYFVSSLQQLLELFFD